MDKLNINFLAVQLREAFDCLDRGDEEDAQALFFSFLDKVEPVLIPHFQRSKNDLRRLEAIRATSNDKSAVFAAELILNYFKNKGVEL
tara:strand:- start:1239 stop:1502 length:264 start_codon:yes stop_codon:yes gene_type:complete